MLPGVTKSCRKDGSVYYRSGITYKNKHISLGSFPTEQEAHQAYLDGGKLIQSDKYTINDDYSHFTLPFVKIVSILNFRDNGIYMKTPIYIRQNYFQYFLSPVLDLKFDMDDLFYYSSRTISIRKGHYYVADYGMQVTIFSRYGIKNYAVKDVDYQFANGDDTDYRYSNVIIINPYYGVRQCVHHNRKSYHVVIHFRNNFSIGYFDSEVMAAIAYNKAVDAVKASGITKNYPTNYIDDISSQEYAAIYSKIRLPEKFLKAVETYCK